MLDLCLLGSGGMMPLPRRWLTALMTRYNGSSLLIDCGEGTQVAVKEKGWSFKPIDVICFTHYHGDHISVDCQGCFLQWEMRTERSRLRWWDQKVLKGL